MESETSGRLQHPYGEGEISLVNPRSEDTAAITRLLGDLGYPATLAEAEAQVAGVRAMPNAILLVATVRSEVLGLITAHIFPSIRSRSPIAWITTLVVAEDARELGVGSMLLKAAERWAAQNGAERVSLTSGAHRTNAHAFYEKKGYENTGLRFSRKL